MGWECLGCFPARLRRGINGRWPKPGLLLELDAALKPLFRVSFGTSELFSIAQAPGDTRLAAEVGCPT
jgi:hypothetical protein